jgi:hypothetical protein
MTINFTNMAQLQEFLRALTSVFETAYGFKNVTANPMMMNAYGDIIVGWRIDNMKISEIEVKIESDFWVSFKFMNGNDVVFEFDGKATLESFINCNDLALAKKYGKVEGLEKLQYQAIMEIINDWC